MNPNIQLREVTAHLKKHYRLWVIPTVAFTVLALFYALTRQPTWQAKQAMIVRDEAGGGINTMGRFDSTEAMKTAQETIQEIARSQNVVRLALEEVGPKKRRKSKSAWPSAEDIESLKGAISIKAPNGAEFGRTEVIHLAVKSNTKERAVELTTAVCEKLDLRLRELRDLKTSSISQELDKAFKLAQSDLDTATLELQKLESNVGTDLGELRVLSNASGGESNLSLALTQVTNELVDARTAHQTKLQARKHLLTAQSDPNHVIAMPNELIQSQPALRRLKDGLVDAQLKTSQLAGRMSKDHPHVKAAMVAEQEVRKDLRAELSIALKGVDADLEVSEARIKALEGQETNIKTRLDRLATLRARYSKLVEQVTQRTEILKKTQTDLADARASQQAAKDTSLITLLDGPIAGNQPLGPGKSAIVLFGFVGGLTVGLGLVFLQSPLGQFRGRRLSDLFPMRRKSDRTNNGRRDANRAGGRRGSDPDEIRSPNQRTRAEDKIEPATGRERREGTDRRDGERRVSRSPSESTS